MEDLSTLARRLSSLPPEQRRLLRQRLEERVGSGRILPRADPAARAPLSFSQQRLWVLDQLLDGGAAYNQTNTVRIQARLDLDGFRRALQEIVRRHEVLRTTFDEVAGEPFQQVRPALTLDVPLVDLRYLEPAHREAEAMRLVAAASADPFDLRAGPLVRATIYRLDVDDHLFALDLHHIVCDGWSMGVFALELSIIYASYTMGRPHPLPEPAVQYADFAVWQRQQFSGERLNTQLRYWRARLAGLRSLDLPADHTRPARFTYRGAHLPFAIEGPLFRSLTALAERENTTLHVLVLTALFVLAHRYTGEDDLAIGTPVAGRTRRELEPLIGFFVNMQVVRADLSGEPAFLEVLARVRQACTAAFGNQDVPFERLVEELAPVRDPSRGPLVQVVFQIFQPPVAVGVQREHVFPFSAAPSGTSKFDLNFELIRHPDSVRGFVEYSTDLFDEARVRRMLGHLQRLLERIVDDPRQPVSRIEFLPEPERRAVTEAWNATATGYPRDSDLVSELRAQAARQASRPAAVFAGRTLSYDELIHLADRVAASLVERGVAHGDCVGLLMPRCLELPAVMAGILAAGACYVPLDPRYPADYLAYLVADSGAKLVATTAALAPVAAGVDPPIVTMDELFGAATASLPAVAPTDTAWLLYTSGTTGRPKGVPVTHRGALRLVHGIDTRAAPDDTVLQFAPITFDASVFEIWMALLHGARLAIHPPDPPSLDELGAFIRDAGVTWAFLTTGLFRQMVEHNAGDLRGVRQLVTGGESLPPAAAEAAWKVLPRTRITNAYGPTECATIATTYTIMGADAIRETVPIGRPIGDTAVYILDRYGNPTPVGVPGEIHIGGDAVGPGYWRRAELTRLSFVPDPWRPPSSMYRTGDIGRFRADGTIEFLGRRDRQVKLSGYRIELQEIEAALASHPAVAAAAVLAADGDADADARLMAFVETVAGRVVAAAELREHLAGALPPHMVPSRVEACERLPLTASGKIDYDGLAARASAAGTGGDGLVEPRDALETLLVGLWQAILPVERIGVTDDFFALGGQSLAATRLLSRVRDTFQASLTMREFFDRPTVEGLAAVLSRNEQVVRRAELIARLGADRPDSASDPALVSPAPAAG